MVSRDLGAELALLAHVWDRGEAWAAGSFPMPQ